MCARGSGWTQRVQSRSCGETRIRALTRQSSHTHSTREQGALLSFAALISLNLGLMNAIPLPALDGSFPYVI